MGPSLFVVVTERGVRQNRDFPLRALAVARRQSVVPEDTRSPILRRARSANDRRPLALGQRTVQHTASRHHFHVRLVPHRGMMNSEARTPKNPRPGVRILRAAALRMTEGRPCSEARG